MYSLKIKCTVRKLNFIVRSQSSDSARGAAPAPLMCHFIHNRQRHSYRVSLYSGISFLSSTYLTYGDSGPPRAKKCFNFDAAWAFDFCTKKKKDMQ